ncbi:hypothetical protein [Phenylobacterium sp.]|uniref:hypothetical protein n=1 Tax=Phenylobacterium sp. TaxID=1871053 RepID=UPI0012147D25|nr:hypothetical protein [Phenylobacterium sp.]THD61391.1 MAG: hypothetical protein E8A49_10365 [Phenylobacterium sp.]
MLAAILALWAAADTAGSAASASPPAAMAELTGAEEVRQIGFVPGLAATISRSGPSGYVALSCQVAQRGAPEQCAVVSEWPQGRGLGHEALKLQPKFQFSVTKGAHGAPASDAVSISVFFKSPDSQFDEQALVREMSTVAANSPRGMGGLGSASTMAPGDPLVMSEVTLLQAPVWSAAASFDDLAKAYPAKGGGAEGLAVDRCRLRRDGGLDGCQVIAESPVGHDFGKAAFALAAKFRVDPKIAAKAPGGAPVSVDLPIRFSPPAALAARTVTSPAWTVGFDPDDASALFPPKAATSGVRTGRGVARCTVAADGSLSACAPEAGDPDGLGFSEAAVKLAAGLKMNLWSADGAPVEGGVVHVPIRLNLVATAASRP